MLGAQICSKEHYVSILKELTAADKHLAELRGRGPIGFKDFFDFVESDDDAVLQALADIADIMLRKKGDVLGKGLKCSCKQC